MPIAITDARPATWIFIALLAAAVLASARMRRPQGAFSPAASQELKGVAILGVLFGHIGYFLVSDYHFLYPISLGAGVGVNVFLLLSGFGLTTGMLNRRLPALEFYRRRMIKVFIPFWLALGLFLLMDALLLGRDYGLAYMLRSALGWFPRADMQQDINSPFWYISWMLMYYVVFPLVFDARRPWLTALATFAIGQGLVWWAPAPIEQVRRLYEVHTVAFPLGVLLAWWLHSPKQAPSPRVERFLAWRDQLPRLPHTLLCGLLLAVVCLTLYKHGVNKGVWREQSISMITTCALILLFMLKRVEFGLVALVGEYSYEIYLLHWPLMARYDLLYPLMPAWAATALYLALFLALGWLMQRLTGPIGQWVDGKRQRA